MAQKQRLRMNRYGTVINFTSARQETELAQAVVETSEAITEKFGVALEHNKRVMLQSIVEELRRLYPTVDFSDPFPTSSMNPDGGILALISRDGRDRFPILISEAKNQGTNDLRAAEGLPPQAKGNAIERLGKNVIGFRTMMIDEQIMPFVCFGYGIDFDDESSILDRVKTIAMFGSLNTVHVMNQGDDARFGRGSFFFRRARWSREEMVTVMIEIATRATHYYIAKHGENAFQQVAGR